MNRRMRDDLRGSFMASVGWLFADMLLVLTMIFVTSNTFSFQSPPPKPTPKPSHTLSSVKTPTVAHLDKTPCDFMLHNLDYTGLLQHPPGASAIKDAQQKVKAQSCLQQHREQKAGLVEAFGGAAAPDGVLNPNNGAQIASRVNTFVLLKLGRDEQFIFTQDTVYVAYHDLGNPYGTVELIIYLLA